MKDNLSYMYLLIRLANILILIHREYIRGCFDYLYCLDQIDKYISIYVDRLIINYIHIDRSYSIICRYINNQLYVDKEIFIYR